MREQILHLLPTQQYFRLNEFFNTQFGLFITLGETAFENIVGKGENFIVCLSWLVVLEFNATLTAKVISWLLVTHMCFLAFSH